MLRVDRFSGSGGEIKLHRGGPFAALFSTGKLVGAVFEIEFDADIGAVSDSLAAGKTQRLRDGSGHGALLGSGHTRGKQRRGKRKHDADDHDHDHQFEEREAARQSSRTRASRSA